MLSDRQSQVSSAAAQLLTSILTHRGDTLSAEVTYSFIYLFDLNPIFSFNSIKDTKANFQ